MVKKIYIVEDDVFLVKVLKAKIQDSGIEVSIFKNGLDVYKRAKIDKPDLILMDLIMPVKNGFEVLEELHSDPVTKNIPIVTLSQLGEPEDTTKALKMGAKEHLYKKGYDFSGVLEVVNKYLSAK